jgi:predicted Zn-ribbon and HTH transcriptional regulator
VGSQAAGYAAMREGRPYLLYLDPGTGATVWGPVQLLTLGEHRALCESLAVDADLTAPTGMYRAHRAIAPGECAHCGARFRVGQEIGYNSFLPGRHKVICGDCFYGRPHPVWQACRDCGTDFPWGANADRCPACVAALIDGGRP